MVSLSLCLITSSWYIYTVYMYILYIYYTYIHVVMFMYCVLTFNVKARDICCCNGGPRKPCRTQVCDNPYDIPPIHSNIKIYIYICKYIYIWLLLTLPLLVTIIIYMYHRPEVYNIIQYYLIVQAHSGFREFFFLHMFYLLQDDYICIVGWLLCGILPFNISGIITIHYGNFYITSIFRDDVAGFEHCSNVEENTWVGHGWAFRPFWDLIRN